MQPYSFVRVTPTYTGVVNANVNDIWKIVKQWAPSLWIKECAGVPVQCWTWKCITDPRSVNPFPGSFVNYINTLRFTPLSNPAQTLADWSGELWTDWEMMDVMENLLADFYKEALGSLEKQILAEQTLKAPRLEHNDSQRYSPKNPINLHALQQTYDNHFV